MKPLLCGIDVEKKKFNVRVMVKLELEAVKFARINISLSVVAV